MSLTIRMRRALAAFRADPETTLLSIAKRQGATYVTTMMPSVMEQVTRSLESLGREMREEDSIEWKIHSDYHRSRVIHGKRLNWHINGKGKQSAQYGTTMYYGSNVRQLFRGLGLKDTW